MHSVLTMELQDPEMNRPGAKAIRKKKSKKDQAEDQVRLSEMTEEPLKSGHSRSRSNIMGRVKMVMRRKRKGNEERKMSMSMSMMRLRRRL